MDKLTKSAHFLPIRETTHVHELAEIFQQDIVRLHGVPVSIVSVGHRRRSRIKVLYHLCQAMQRMITQHRQDL